MSNVLPPQSKRMLWRRYRARFLSAAALLALVAAFVAGFALLPSYLVLRIGTTPPETTQLTTDMASAADRDTLSHAQTLLSALSPLAIATSTPSSAIASIVDAQPPGISIVHITFTAGAPSSLVVSGQATSIDAINAFQQALRASGRFASVIVPVADLAGASSGQFSVTLTGAF